MVVKRGEVEGVGNQTNVRVERRDVGRGVDFFKGWGDDRGIRGCLHGRAQLADGPSSSVRMFGHVHRAMCSCGCQFEVLEEHVCARCVPAYKTDEAGTESVGAGGASEARWRADWGGGGARVVWATYTFGQPPPVGCVAIGTSTW